MLPGLCLAAESGPSTAPRIDETPQFGGGRSQSGVGLCSSNFLNAAYHDPQRICTSIYREPGHDLRGLR
jgi:hypothetical protein